MKKLPGNVKATKLLVDDHIKVGGVMYRITSLTLDFGRSTKRVRIHMHSTDKKTKSYINLNVPSTTEFAVWNQK